MSGISNWSDGNYSPEVPMMGNGRPMMASLVPIQCLTDPATAEDWSKSKNAFFPAPARPSLFAGFHGEIRFALADSASKGGVLETHTALGGYDGPRDFSLQAAKLIIKEKLPGHTYASLRERYLAELATATIEVIGTAINTDQVYDTEADCFGGQKPTTVQVSGLDSFWNEKKHFVRTREILRARCPTEDEIKQRKSVQHKIQGQDPDKITLIVETSSPMSFSQRAAALRTAHLRAPHVHYELAVLCRNRIAASEINAHELMNNARIITAIRGIGYAADTGIVRFNGPHTKAQIEALLDGTNRTGFAPDFAQIVGTRNDTADVRMNPSLTIGAFVCRPNTKELVLPPTSERMSSPPNVIPPIAADPQPCLAPYRGEDLEACLGSFAFVFEDTDAAFDDSTFGGTVKKFKENNIGNQCAMAWRTGLIHRIDTVPVKEDPKVVRFWPGSYRNALNQLDNRFFTAGTGGAHIGLADREPDHTRQTGRWLIAVQLRAQSEDIAYASMWSSFHSTVIGVAAEGAGQGGRVTYVHTNSGTC